MPQPAAKPAFFGTTLVVAFAAALTLRIWHIGQSFWLLRDQIRDWEIALGPFTQLPLVGPATHVDGYTVGPAFYWILWAIRVVVGPFFSNLPHAGGIGQAALLSAADVLLLAALWRRTGSRWLALTVAVLLVTASFDLALAPLIWNPVVGSLLARIAVALVLLDWPRASALRAAIVAAVAWSAVHAYTGAVFVAVSVFGYIVLEPAARRDWPAVKTHAAAVVAAVLALQIPYGLHQVLHRFGDSAMGAVTGSVGRILSGQAPPEIAKSVSGYMNAFTFIQITPWRVPLAPWILAACGASVAIRYRRDPAVLTMTLLPQAMAIAGYSLFLGALDNYYYLSLMPSAVLTVVLGVTSVVPEKATAFVSGACVVGALALTPARVGYSATLFHMPQYGAMVSASRTLARRGQPLRALATEFTLPPTGDPEFLYRILGGRLDPAAEWVGVITAEGGVSYRHVGS